MTPAIDRKKLLDFLDPIISNAINGRLRLADAMNTASTLKSSLFKGAFDSDFTVETAIPETLPDGRCNPDCVFRDFDEDWDKTVYGCAQDLEIYHSSDSRKEGGCDIWCKPSSLCPRFTKETKKTPAPSGGGAQGFAEIGR